MFSFFLHFRRRLGFRTSARPAHPSNGRSNGNGKYLVRLDALPSPTAGRVESLRRQIREGRYPTFEAVWGAAARLADLFLTRSFHDDPEN